MEFAYAISHYFFPRYSNNHRAKLIHSASLVLVALLFIAYQFVLQAIPLSGVNILGYAANIPPDQIISLTNQKRSESGATPLAYSAQLSQAAKLKGEHMLSMNYWSHVAPDGTEPWKFFGDVGYRYRYAGENLARDFSNPQDAINAWMASPSHKENMLSTKYKEIGVAVVEGDLGGVETTIIVQLFGTQLTDTAPQFSVAEARPQVTIAPTPTAVLPTAKPTLVPTSVPVAAQLSPFPTSGSIAPIDVPAQQNVNTFQILISPFATTRSIAIATTLIFIAVFVIDGFVVTRRKIPRYSGRTFAHIAFLGMILAIVLIAKAGKIM
jgi:hypothetical protein